MSKKTVGIHHITAIVGHPQENVDFYAGVLGLRLVKQTVNFDDPARITFILGMKEENLERLSHFSHGQGHIKEKLVTGKWRNFLCCSKRCDGLLGTTIS